MAQNSLSENLKYANDCLDDIKNAIEYGGIEVGKEPVDTYDEKIIKIVDDKNASIEELDNLNKDLNNENNELENTVTEYESNFLDINNAILNKGVNPAGGYDTYADAISEIGGDEVTVNLQSKEVKPTVDGVTVTPDADYNGLSSVVVKPVTLQEKQVAPALEEIEVLPDDGNLGLSKVVVGAVTADIDENIKPENIVKDVEILGVKGTHECESIEPAEPVLVELNVTPTTEVQEFTPAEGEDGYSKVTVDAIPEGSGGVADPVLSPLEITPTPEEQVIETPDGVDGFSPVTVKKVDSTIDSNIQADNIRSGITILGILDTFVGTGDAPVFNNADYIGYKNCRSISECIKLIKDCTSFNYAFYEADLTADTYNFDLSQATSWTDWLNNARSKNIDKETTINIIVGTKIDSLLKGLNYNGNTNRIMHVKLSKPADVVLTSAQGVLNSANYIDTLDFGNIFDNVESINCSRMLASFNSTYTKLLEVDLTSLDFSKINNANRMFDSSNLANIILGNVNLTGINCEYMFCGVNNIKYNNALNFTDCNLNYTFTYYQPTNLKINIKNNDVNKCSNQYAFNNSKLVTITSDETWDLIPNCANMFYYNNSLVSAPEMNIHIIGSNKDNISSICQGCSSLEEVNINIIYDNPDTYWRLYCDNAFNGCTKLRKITGLDLSGQYAQYNNIFAGNTSLEEIIGKGTLAGYNTTASMTWDLSASPVFRPLSWLQSLDATPDGKTRIIKLHADVYNSLSEEVIALATEKNITLASA